VLQKASYPRFVKLVNWAKPQKVSFNISSASWVALFTSGASISGLVRASVLSVLAFAFMIPQTGFEYT
jgi:hypothetical protein